VICVTAIGFSEGYNRGTSKQGDQKMKVAKSTRQLHKKDLKAVERVARKVWDGGLIDEIINLSWGVKSLENLGKKSGASAKEIALLVDLHNAAKLEFLSFSVHNITK
jgi:hypothetical protein